MLNTTNAMVINTPQYGTYIWFVSSTPTHNKVIHRQHVLIEKEGG